MLSLFLKLAYSPLCAQDQWFPFPVEVWNPPFDMQSPRTQVDYVPLDKATQKWNIHVFFPHMQDAYLTG